jgi:hypothetical protein
VNYALTTQLEAPNIVQVRGGIRAR